MAFRQVPSLKGFAYTIWIFAAVTVSLFYPQYFSKIGDFELKKLVIPLLQVIMFGMGSQMSLDDFAGILRQPKGVVIGVACQFAIMPSLGFALATVLPFPPEVATGVILIGCSPSGLASNVMSFIARANVPLSVTVTAVTTLLAPLLTPALLKLLAGQFLPIDFWKMVIEISNMVILPIIAGLMFNLFAYGRDSAKRTWVQIAVFALLILLRNTVVSRTGGDFWPGVLTDAFWFLMLPVAAAWLFKVAAKGRKEWLDDALSVVSKVGIALIITVITAAGRDSLLQIGLLLIVSCLIHNLAGYTLGYWSARLFGLDEQSCRTVAIEVGMQNGGLASGLALQMGKVATVGLAPAVFGPMMNITGSSLATWWRSRPPRILSEP
ncbi:MAG: bile acid:sodium symporter family protein [Cytophagales bacterium]|nr:bile acid:sodium symporter family protein [Cytophagales bacterium]